jgi:hypothetical protein
VTKRNTTAGFGARHWRREADQWRGKAIERGVVLACTTAFVASDTSAAAFKTLAQYRVALLGLLQTLDAVDPVGEVAKRDLTRARKTDRILW